MILTRLSGPRCRPTTQEYIHCRKRSVRKTVMKNNGIDYWNSKGRIERRKKIKGSEKEIKYEEIKKDLKIICISFPYFYCSGNINSVNISLLVIATYIVY
jgi:hypothetical protein